MPPPARILIWPLIKELLFNKMPIMEYFKRNKLITGLFIAVLTLTISNLFITEQAIRLNNASQNKTTFMALQKELIDTKVLYGNTRKELDECLHRVLPSIPVVKNCPKQPQKPNRKHTYREEAILPRNTENSLKKKLDAIRYE